MSFSLEFEMENRTILIDQPRRNSGSVYHQKFRCYDLDKPQLTVEPSLWAGLSIPVEGASINWQAIADAVDRQTSTMTSGTIIDDTSAPTRRR
jgi:hypothetical protein